MPIARNLRRLVCLPKDVCFLVRSTSSNLRLRRMNTSAAPPSFTTLLYSVSDRVANIQLNRPERMNAINEHMPGEIQAAVKLANDNKDVKVIILSGTKVFCSGYDLKQFAESERGTVPGNQTMPWDPYIDFQLMDGCNSAFMSLWRSYKPVICKINGVAIGGGSDMALVCDLTVAAEDARIGYPPSRVFGCPTTAMWVYRVGIEKAKRILLTGDILTGRQAADIGLIGEAVPADQLDQAVDRLVQRLVTVPTNQMFFQKQVINNAVEMMGLFSSQRLATFIDGMTRHTPEGVAFTERARAVGFKQAVKERDMGREADWSTMGKAKL